MDVLQNLHKFRVLWHGRTELTDVPGGYENTVPVSRVFGHGAYRTNRSSGYGHECTIEITKCQGTGMKVLQNFQKFYVRVGMMYRTNKRSGYGKYSGKLTPPRPPR